MLADAQVGSRFAELMRSPHVDLVVSANRLYLTAAVADPLTTEQRRWAMSCLPSTNGHTRFSTISMSGMETFAVFKPNSGGAPEAMVIVSRAELERAGTDFKDLDMSETDYVAGGDDQLRVSGDWSSLATALAAPALRTAARVLAGRLMRAETSYARFHDGDLADRVLGRAF